MSRFNILFFGDLVGIPGQEIFKKHVGRLKKQYQADMIIVNGENSSATGRGIIPRTVQLFKDYGVDVITSGNHIWRSKEIYTYLQNNKDLLRPANYPSGCPGVGVTIVNKGSFSVGVINIQGQVFMADHVDNPFKVVDSLCLYLKDKTDIIFVDIHAEATSEKLALAFYLDGRVSCIVGTHTHVQTADERILPKGTAYITDAGMAGSLNSLIGMQPEAVLRKFLTQMPARFEVSTTDPIVLCGVAMTINGYTGQAEQIERIRVLDDLGL